MTLCYVSAFIDIGRATWPRFARSVEEYISHFDPFIRMFQSIEYSEFQMIVFIDAFHYNTLRTRIPENSPIRLIACSHDYLVKHIPTWSYLSMETEIIQSESYKHVVGERHRLYPENFSAEYTIMTTSKVDFVVHAMSHVTSDYYCWLDFGYFKRPQNIPKRPLDIHKLDLDRINLQILSPLLESDQDLFYTIQHAPERIAGAFIFGRGDKFILYQLLYHIIHREFHTLGLVDDDQHLALRCYYRQPELFRLHQHNWSQSLVVFQKD